VIQPLNYSRQLRKQCRQYMAAAPEISAEMLTWAESAVKIQLPDGGRLIGDRFNDLLNGQDLNLPFDSIALEYRAGEWSSHDQARSEKGERLVCSAKRIILAKHWESSKYGECIMMREVCWSPAHMMWGAMPIALIPRRGIARPPGKGYAISAYLNPIGIGAKTQYWSMPQIPIDDMGDAIGCVMDFLAAMHCSNIRLEKKQARRLGRKATKGALSFDSYHYLTVDVPGKSSAQGEAFGERRSPREHIRRGHIRRLSDGRAIWINATMVNAGIGSRVDKGYIMRAAG